MNILLIVLDSISFEDTSFAQNTLDTTPFLETIAKTIRYTHKQEPLGIGLYLVT